MEAAAVRNRAAAPARAKPRPKPRSRPVPARRPGGQLIPIARGTATAVRHLPDSGLVVRLTRGRAWIGVLGVLLVGIVALNVVTLSLAASAGHVYQNIQALEKENSVLRSRDAQRSGVARLTRDARGIGLTVPATTKAISIAPGRDDIAVAAGRLGAAGSGH
jgi:hypothetical protein